MAITIDKWTLERRPAWMTADGSVHVYSPLNSGWYLRGLTAAAHRALGQAGLKVGDGPHAATRGEALQIAHRITGCATSIRQDGTQYSIVGHDYQLSPICTLYLQRDDKNGGGWRIWRSGLPHNAAFDYHFNVFSKRRYPTRLAALQAFDQWMENCPLIEMPADCFCQTLPDDVRVALFARTYRQSAAH